MAQCSRESLGLSQLMDKLDKWSNCIICRSRYQNTKILSCFHYFCQGCLQKIIDEARDSSCPSCPVCRQPFTAPEDRASKLPSFCLIDELAKVCDQENDAPPASHIEPKCNICVKNIDATVFCIDCGRCLCPDCAVYHGRFKLEKHKVIPIDDVRTTPIMSMLVRKNDDSFCREPGHGDNCLNKFCSSCQKAVCGACEREGHVSHGITNLSVAVDQTFKETGGMLASLEKQIIEKEKTRDKLKRYVSALKQTYSECQREVEEFTSGCINILKAKEMQILKKLKMEEQMDCKRTEQLFDQLELQIRTRESLRQFTDALRTFGNNLKQVEEYPNITKQFKIFQEEAVDETPIGVPKITFCASEVIQRFLQKEELGRLTQSSINIAPEINTERETQETFRKGLWADGCEQTFEKGSSSSSGGSTCSSSTPGSTSSSDDVLFDNKPSYLTPLSSTDRAYDDVDDDDEEEEEDDNNDDDDDDDDDDSPVYFIHTCYEFNCFSVLSKNQLTRELPPLPSDARLPGLPPFQEPIYVEPLGNQERLLFSDVFKANMKVSGFHVTEDGDILIVSHHEKKCVLYNQKGQTKACLLEKLSNPWDAVSFTMKRATTIYVTDMGNGNKQGRVLKYSTCGQFLGCLVKKLTSPNGIAVNKVGEIFICDVKESAIIIINISNGKSRKLKSLKSYGLLQHPWYIAVSNNDDLLVSDCGTKEVLLFDRNMTCKKRLGFKGPSVREEPYSLPSMCDLDDDGNVYVVDQHSRLLNIWRKNGDHLEIDTNKNNCRPVGVAVFMSNLYMVTTLGTVVCASLPNINGQSS